ncbi:hypothetical protein [Wolbachia endosymbiont of Folsomia candida]|uniref:hypothetical protein n=1 Tax=Wolbachia endosymbiont of Folsomia candida TaxID=169402 RepID=UPI000AE7AE2A|nr:hypothetical protein [Wolbachia endosymbiont of Folsomia candida]
MVNSMVQGQERLSVNVSFEGEFAQYLTDMAKIQNRTIEEVVKDLVEEEIEVSKLSEDDDEMDEGEIALAELSLKRDVPGAKRIKYENIKWR